MQKPIFLIGMPGCGKTTLARALGRTGRFGFVDLDHYIEGRFSCSVADIFARYGETRFREIERNLLHEVGEMNDVVVACGGGTPCFFDNIGYMNSHGTTVWLKASRGRLIERLDRARAKRPAVAALKPGETGLYVDRLLEERAPYYSQARFHLDSTELESRRSVQSAVDKFLSLIESSRDNAPDEH